MIEALAAHTYEVRHSPNCPMQFLVVTCGSAGRILHRGDTDCGRNFYGYGHSLDDAAADVIRQMVDAESVKRIARAESEVSGVVWA